MLSSRGKDDGIPIFFSLGEPPRGKLLLTPPPPLHLLFSFDVDAIVASRGPTGGEGVRGGAFGAPKVAKVVV